ncbi:flavin-containing monooxygenase [Arthrobacter sp. EPSL27]|uniref:flavin-containing monooxygenase n=1 Tax=Arthrobacter sp. EPSL27 TaxID=1745378 RepID=UPI000746A24D|nr:NAD(P)/FAD-dependent oxidoreductase [Arthrobacter sp. EPSL27]KUM37400.1 hypothetical protein AR539_09050 [Arthrobacter sp. EPSL27]
MNTSTEKLNATAPTEEQIANAWLGSFSTALASNDLEELRPLLSSDVWWRDLVIVNWDLTTAHGFDEVASFLGSRIFQAGITDLALDPKNPPTPFGNMVQAFYTFKTKVAEGRGIIRLVQEAGEWRAWSILTKIEGIVGRPELTTSVFDAAKPAYNQPVGERLSWNEYRDRQREFLDGDPEVVVIGGGHSGLCIAARLGHLGLSTLVVEKNERIGDNWRLRYHNLSLHDTKWYGQFPYLAYPDNWPVFSPKDLLSDWMEAYAWILQLNVWTNSTAEKATYDAEAGQWEVTIKRDGLERVLHPKHIVFATGAFAGTPQLPETPGREKFKGQVIHSSQHAGGHEVKGKRVIVVGSGASGHDVAQDAFEMGASVTMVQRGPTYVVSSQYGVPKMHADLYSESSPPIDDADLIGLSYPWHLFLASSGPMVDELAEVDKELLDGLEKAGFRTTLGENKSGLFGLSLRRGGGYYIDKGCSRLIIEGKIRVQPGEIAEFTETGVIYADGSKEDADIVVFATGWPNMREAARPIVGDEVTDQLTTIWDLDEQGEIKGAFRPSGHPNLWFQAGGFQQARYGSKLLALQILGVELGHNDQVSTKVSVTVDA